MHGLSRNPFIAARIAASRRLARDPEPGWVNQRWIASRSSIASFV